jgi:hypothetical protein
VAVAVPENMLRLPRHFLLLVRPLLLLVVVALVEQTTFGAQLVIL